ncbi:uncharacterized protein [Venturia canescens]|uniref:uncharacterized protein n=1 Tax=Venturia canescens TaxID=32260 RepID=UPI001C9C76D7|nr:uncharacterized protein LOC122418462 [Venturia canescens]
MTYAVTRQIRSLGFPENTGMGIFFAVSIPIDIPNKSIAVSFYFEANYRLPDYKNSSYSDEYFGVRSLDRRLLYEMLQSKLERAGFPGKPCLMRAICDAAKKPLTKNGLVDLLRRGVRKSRSKFSEPSSRRTAPGTKNARSTSWIS